MNHTLYRRNHRSKKVIEKSLYERLTGSTEISDSDEIASGIWSANEIMNLL